MRSAGNRADVGMRCMWQFGWGLVMYVHLCMASTPGQVRCMFYVVWSYAHTKLATSVTQPTASTTPTWCTHWCLAALDVSRRSLYPLDVCRAAYYPRCVVRFEVSALTLFLRVRVCDTSGLQPAAAMRSWRIRRRRRRKGSSTRR